MSNNVAELLKALQQQMNEQQAKRQAMENLMVREVTGAPSLPNEPDTLFYTMFSHDDAAAFYGIYETYRRCAEEDPFLALKVLKNGLRDQCVSMAQRNICPVEIMMFASRLIMSDLLHQEQVRYILIKVLLEYLDDARKSIEYILDGWEWPAILRIVIEACGAANNGDLIGLVMDRAPGLIRKYANEQDHLIVDALIDMLCHAQDREDIPCFGDIFEVPNACTPGAEGYLIDRLHADEYLRGCANQVIEELCSRNVPVNFRDRLQYARGDRKRDQSPPLRNAEEIYALHFGGESNESLTRLQKCRDKSLAPDICQVIVERLDEINPYQRARAVLLLSSKGSGIPDCEEFVVPFLRELPEKDEELTVPVVIALCDYRQIEAQDVFKIVGACDDSKLWNKAVGFHLKNIDTYLLQPNLFNYVRRELSSDTPEQEKDAALNAMCLLCRAYNGKHNLLQDRSKSQTIVENMLSTVQLALRGNCSDRSCRLILEMIKMLIRANTDHIDQLLRLLDQMKNVPGLSGILTEKIDGIIRNVDHARPPEGNERLPI